MQFIATRIPGVILIKPRVFTDSRGFFVETWQQQEFAVAGIDAAFVQDNHSRSARWVLRGMHYQIDNAQGKLIRVVRGAVFDVAVDMRRSSPTFGQWIGEELNDVNNHMLWVPPGLAHGFLALADQVDLAYKCTDFYSPRAERIIAWDDSTLGIQWPLPSGVSPIVSPRDAQAGGLADAELFP
jgi:dTDP-4-dehydrorhamnose 3,5-epimerase